MAEINKVVVRYLSGTVLKGTTQDFFPNRPTFHLQPLSGGPVVDVKCGELKAVFFVREHGGKPERHNLQGFIKGPGETPQGNKVAVLFEDGELMCGYSLGYNREREGFFLHPADTGSNNIRAYVFAAATREVKAGAAAEELVRKVMGRTAA